MRYECRDIPYTLVETISGCDVYDALADDEIVCEIDRPISSFEDEFGNIDEDAIMDEINKEIEYMEFSDMCHWANL